MTMARLNAPVLFALALLFAAIHSSFGAGSAGAQTPSHAQIEAPSNPETFADVAQGADGSDGSGESLPEGPVQQLADWSAQLDELSEDAARESLTIDALGSLRDEVVAIRNDIQVLVDELAPRLAEQRALLEGLTPAEGELAETPEVLAQQERIATLETELQPAELLLGRANALREEIVARRAAEFTDRLFGHSSSILAPQLWIDGLSDVPRLVQRLRDLTANSWAALQARATPASLAGLGVLLLVVVLLAMPLRRFALRKAGRESGKEPSSFEKTLGALRITLVSTLIPAVAILMLMVGLETVGGLSLRANAILESLALATVAFFFVSGLIQAFLAPGLTAWRLVPVKDGYAGRAAGLLRLAALVYLLGEVLRTIAAVFVSPLVVLQLLEAGPALVTALVVLVGARALLRGLDRSESEDAPAVVGLLWRWTVPVAVLAALAALVAQLFGYLALAAFIVDQLVWTAVVLAALHLSAALVEGLSAATFQDDTPASIWLHENVGLSRAGLGQFGVILSGITKLVLIIAAASFIIAPFGVETGQFTEIFGRVFTGIEIGGFSFSLTSVLVALALVFVGVVITRAIQGWLENRYLPRTSLDTGLKASIRTGIGYIGIIAAAAIGLSSLGLNLENVALVAGALSVGIGFGLQSIVSNFVSGLILLAERPFKQGDWIVVGEEQGIVKRINVRATELQTFDRATVLIPNSDFISGTVKNRVHRDTLGRIDVPVGVAYDSDPEKVREILLEVANAHPMTLSYPEPVAFFIEFGASSLDFMLFAFLADVGNGYGVRSDLRFEIFRRFKEEGIEIPFAQSDVSIRNLDEVLDALAKAGLPLPEGLGAGGLSPEDGVKQAGVQTVPAPDRKQTGSTASTIETEPEPSPDDGPAAKG